MHEWLCPIHQIHPIRQNSLHFEKDGPPVSFVISLCRSHFDEVEIKWKMAYNNIYLINRFLNFLRACYFPILSKAWLHTQSIGVEFGFTVWVFSCPMKTTLHRLQYIWDVQLICSKSKISRVEFHLWVSNTKKMVLVSRPLVTQFYFNSDNVTFEKALRLQFDGCTRGSG